MAVAIFLLKLKHNVLPCAPCVGSIAFTILGVVLSFVRAGQYGY